MVLKHEQPRIYFREITNNVLGYNTCNANEFFYRESLAAGSLNQLPAPLEHILADA